MVWKRQRSRTDRSGSLGSEAVEPEAVGPEAGPEVTDGPGEERANPATDPVFLGGLRPIPTGGLAGRQPWPAVDIVGVTPSGEHRRLSVDSASGPVLLAFLTTNCDGCDGFWDGLRDGAESPLPEGVEVVIVTRGEGAVDRSEVARVAEGIESVPVIMSDQAWSDYHVLGYPFFVVVDAPSRSVVAETVGFGWADVAALVG
jgi:hypothetical protein